MKIIFGSDVKRIKAPTTYLGLLDAVLNSFKFDEPPALGQNYKLYYLDEGDVISLTG